MKLFGSLVGFAALAAAIPYKVEKKAEGEKSSLTLTSLTWKADYKPSTENEDSTLSIDLLGGFADTVNAIKEALFQKEVTPDFCETVVVPCEDEVEEAEEALEEAVDTAAVVAEAVAEVVAETASEVLEAVTETVAEAIAEVIPTPAEDAKFDEAVAIALEEGKISTSMLQRKLSIGYSRASKIIAAMEAKGMIAPYDGKNAREVLIKSEQI